MKLKDLLKGRDKLRKYDELREWEEYFGKDELYLSSACALFGKDEKNCRAYSRLHQATHHRRHRRRDRENGGRMI